MIDGNGSSIHVELLLLKNLIATPTKTRAPMWRKKRGALESPLGLPGH
jgi:hypothetical protein